MLCQKRLDLWHYTTVKVATYEVQANDILLHASVTSTHMHGITCMCTRGSIYIKIATQYLRM